MIAFALIFVSSVPMAVDLVREVWAVRDWSTVSAGHRRQMLREAGLTVLCLAAMLELGLRFALRM